MEIYKDKSTHYFSNIRYDLVSLVPENPENKILEIGAGSGDTLIAIKNRNLAKEVVGMELNRLENSNQQNPLIDRMIFGNIEIIDLDFPTDYFDVILCGDVLEHLIDPWKTIETLKKYLKRDGIIILSIPNIRFYKALLQIYVKGSFEYTSHGLFDKTHLRFFCKKDMVKLFSSSSFKIDSVKSILEFIPHAKIKILNKITFGLFHEFLSMQFLVVARKL